MPNTGAKVVKDEGAMLMFDGQRGFGRRLAGEAVASALWGAWEGGVWEWPTTSGGPRHPRGELFLAIECKKTRTDILIFLRPVGHSHTGDLEECRCLRGEQIRDSEKRLELYCEPDAEPRKGGGAEARLKC